MAGGSNPANVATPQTVAPQGAAPAATTPMTPAPAAPGGNIYQQSAGAYTGALGLTGQAAQMPDTQAFMNPFTQNVVDRSMADISTAQQQAQNQMGAQASAAGAFGGSLHGVADAMTNQGFIKQAADTAANLNMQGYTNAQGAAQNYRGMQLAAGGQMGNLANSGFNMGQAISGAQARDGATTNDIMQRIIDAGKAQYGGWTGAPASSLQLPMAAVGAAGQGQGVTTQKQQPGLLNFMSLLMAGA